MGNQTQTGNLHAKPINIGRAFLTDRANKSSSEPLKVTLNVDFTSSNVQDFTIDANTAGIQNIQGMYIDNSNSPVSCAFQIVGSDQTLVCPPYAQGIFPLLNGGHSIIVHAMSASNLIIPIAFLNVAVSLAIWNVLGNTIAGVLTVQGTVTTQPSLGAYTKRNGTIAVGGTSQQIAAANGARKRLFIQNPATAIESLFVQFTSAAGVNDGISIELPPAGSFDTGMGPCTTEVINVNAATAAHAYIAFEM